MNDNNQSNISQENQNEIQISSINNELNNKEDNNATNIIDNHTFEKILKKVSIILTIIISIVGGGFSVLFIFNYFTDDGSSLFDPSFNLVGVFLSLIYTIKIIAYIWIIYFIIMQLHKSYKKRNIKQKRIFKFILISLFFIIIILSVSIKIYNYSNKNLANVLNKTPSYDYYDTSSYYFIYRDKIYYYVLENKNITLSDKLYAMNLDGSGNKKIAETDELRYANFYFVYNNEAYYYTTYYNENKKINLLTGKITNLDNNDIYLAKTLKNGKINTFIDNAISGDSYSILKKIDLTTNTIVSEIKTPHSISGQEYCFDYEGGNIYYLEDSYSDSPKIYKNTDIVYQFANKQNNDIEFIAVNEKYLYFKSENHIYKLNVNTKEIEKEVYYDLGDIKRIGSGNNIDNYFYINNKIYEFNLTSDTFNLVLDDVEKQPQYIYNINNKLIFTENTDNFGYNNFGSVLIYNISTNDIEKFDKIRKVSFDENHMYLLINNKNNYIVKKYKLN